MFASTPKPPYYAVIFSSKMSSDTEGYAEMAQKMEHMALACKGCLGAESARGADGFGITVSYWDSEENMRAWKLDAEHLLAQKLGREKWYESYYSRVARVERAYSNP